MALRRKIRVTLALLPLCAAAACVSQTNAPNGARADLTGTTSSQPGTATYSCADGGMMTIQNLGGSIRVLGPDGAINEELPASPAGQNSRYGEAHDAIVIDGRDALVMKGGATPLPCTR